MLYQEAQGTHWFSRVNFGGIVPQIVVGNLAGGVDLIYSKGISLYKILLCSPSWPWTPGLKQSSYLSLLELQECVHHIQPLRPVLRH